MCPQPASRRAQWRIGILTIASMCSDFGTGCQCETNGRNAHDLDRYFLGMKIVLSE
jgi:hypothetical protein